MSGVNRELFPLARMTYPRGFERLDDEPPVLGRTLFRSWILALGFIPVEYDDITLAEIDPGSRFLECSELLTQREWVHERTVEPHGAGCLIADRVHFVPRVSVLGPLHLLVFRATFWLRHRNLARIFGVPS